MSEPAKTSLPTDAEAAIAKVSDGLKGALGDNLHSLALYGSAVRGNFVPGQSDINLLIVLEHSTPEAHEAIAEVLRRIPQIIEPLVLGRQGLERSVQCFLPKFLSIRRNYRVLAGVDSLRDIRVNEDVHRLLCEQALRNLRLRLKRAFIKRESDARWVSAMIDRTPALFVSLSDTLRCVGKQVPGDFAARVPLIAETFATDAAVLTDLLRLKQAAEPSPAASAAELHGRVHALLNAAIAWMETQWPELLPPQKN